MSESLAAAKTQEHTAAARSEPKGSEARGVRPTLLSRLQTGAGNRAVAAAAKGEQTAAGMQLVADALASPGFGLLARQPVDAPRAPAPELMVIPSSLFVGGDVIQGPLAAGAILEHAGLTVEQTSLLEARVTYGGSTVTIRAADGGRAYAYAVGPPGPAHEPQLPSLGSSGLIFMPDPDAPKVLPQRLVRVTHMSGVQVDWRPDPALERPPLVVHERFVGNADDVYELGMGLTLWDVLEWDEPDHTTLRLDKTMLRINANAVPDAGAPPGAIAPRRRYAYSIDPEWTGPMGLERRITIVAAPGVTVERGSPESTPSVDYGRELVDEVVRVPHVNSVPEQGAQFTAADFVGVEQHGNKPDSFLRPWLGAQEPTRELLTATTGLAGVTVEHPWSGAQLSIRPKNRESGGAYAYQLLPPSESRGAGEIRVVVAAGVEVELVEPAPGRLERPMWLPDPARPGEGLAERGLNLRIVEVSDPAVVPPQGVPLNLDHFAMQGYDRGPDLHRLVYASDMREAEKMGLDIAVGMIPVVGDLVDIGEFFYAVSSGRDRWGEKVTEGDLVIMGVGAVIGLIPFLGGIGSAARRAGRAALKLADAARAWGKTVEKLEAVLVRVREVVPDADRVVVSRALKGSDLADHEVARLRAIVTELGADAGEMRIAGRATIRLAGFGGELTEQEAKAALRGVIHQDEFLNQVVKAHAATGSVPDELARPLAHSGAFKNGDEVAAALEQSVKDAKARSALDIEVDDAFAEYVGESAGDAVDRILHVSVGTRRTAVSNPALLARYEKAFDKKLGSAMERIVERQAASAKRTRLDVLKQDFEAFRAQVGDARQLTAKQREDAMTILNEARDIADKQWGGLQTKLQKEMRADPELKAFEDEMRALGDISGDRTGAIRVKSLNADGTIRYESLNIEHKVRKSDNPWLYNHPANLTASDAPLNQAYLEALRKHGGIWPEAGSIDDFVVRHGLNRQGIDFAPGGH